MARRRSRSMVSSSVRRRSGGLRLRGTGSSVIAPPFQRSTRSARPSSWSRRTLMPTSSSRLRSSCLRSLSVVVAADHTPPRSPPRVRMACFLLRGQGFRARMLAAGEFLLGVGDLLQRLVPLSLQSPSDQAVVGVDSPVAALCPVCLVAGLLGLAPPLRKRGVVAVLKLLGGGQAHLQRRGLERGQERTGDRCVDRDTADAQVTGATALDELAGARAVVAGRGLGGPVVVDGELAATRPAGGQPLQQRAALPDRAGAGLVGPRAGVGADAGLVGLVGVPVDEAAVMFLDQNLPLALRKLVTAGAQLAVLADAAPLAGLAEHIGARVGGMGQHVVHRMIGRLDPGDLLAAQVGGRL